MSLLARNFYTTPALLSSATLLSHPFPAAPAAAAPPTSGRELISSITLRAPLLGVGPARLALRCGEGQLMDWILSGDLEWAFDLRRAGARRLAACAFLPSPSSACNSAAAS